MLCEPAVRSVCSLQRGSLRVGKAGATRDQLCSDLGAHLGGSSPEGAVLAVAGQPLLRLPPQQRSQPLGYGNQQVSVPTGHTAPGVWDPSDRSQTGHGQHGV